MAWQPTKVIMRDSDEAASIKTVTGWVSASGHFFGDDERTARYNGSTHQRCENNPDHPIYEKFGYCTPCHHDRRQKVFTAMPKQEWDGEPLVIFDSDTYFFDDDSLMDYCADNNIAPQDMQLVICYPNMAREIDSDYWSNELSEDGDLPPELEAALNTLNEVVRRASPLSWSQGKFAAIIADHGITSNEKE